MSHIEPHAESSVGAAPGGMENTPHKEDDPLGASIPPTSRAEPTPTPQPE